MATHILGFGNLQVTSLALALSVLRTVIGRHKLETLLGLSLLWLPKI